MSRILFVTGVTIGRLQGVLFQYNTKRIDAEVAVSQIAVILSAYKKEIDSIQE